MQKSCVVKIGGSILFSNDKINYQKIAEFCDVISKRLSTYNTIVLVCGGGIIARNYINIVRNFGGSEALCDEFGIDASRINSKLFIARLGEFAYPQVPKSLEDLSIAKLFNKVIVMGGLTPGQSTTSVAVEAAEYIKANELIILTDVDGIYDKDPKKFKNAKLLSRMTYDDVQKIIIDSSGDHQAAAGEYRILDAVSLQILKRSKIKVIITSGNDLNEFKKYWAQEKDVIGTVITS